MTEPLPKGWYSDPTAPNRLRLWDGSSWTDETAALDPTSTSHSKADISSAPEPSRRRKALWAGALIGSIALIASGATAVAAFLSTGGPPHTAASPSPTTTTSAAPTLPPNPTSEQIDAYIDSLPDPAPAPSKNEQLDSQWEDYGFTTLISGNVYLQPADPADFTCGYLDCIFYTAYTVTGCPGGLYIEGSIDAGGVSIGPVNEMTASLGPEEMAQIMFEDYTGRGDAFRITGARCY